MKYTKWAPVLVLAGFAAACDQNPVGPSPAPQFTHAVNSTPALEQLRVCKVGPAASFTVSYSPAPGNDFGISAFDLADGECMHIATSGAPATATIVETPGVGSHLVSIAVAYAGDNVTAEQTNVGTSTAIVTIGEDPSGAGVDPGPSGATVTFTNELDPPPGDEGCTPGYWKQEQHFDSWEGHDPTDLVGGVFTGADASLADDTLLQALNYGGGPGLLGAQQILLRAAVAALLNASSSGVDYTLTEAQVIAAVDAALASGDRDTILAAAAALDADNNLGCTLN
jgi:hypothetical protein